MSSRYGNFNAPLMDTLFKQYFGLKISLKVRVRTVGPEIKIIIPEEYLHHFKNYRANILPIMYYSILMQESGLES